MSLDARYCAHCGGDIVTKVVDGRSREVCSKCEKIFYKNPLPVASCVVLNRDREVLLVKRKNEPHKGKWCLPIGFAEMGETIADAAKRELMEETGVDALVMGLLDADSYESDFYGDLLIVTFEMKKVGGEECPGDDAQDVSYFALNWVPPLAFSSNEKALKACMASHKEEWAIQDSFKRLQAGEDEEMLSDALIALIRDHAEEITRLWLADIRTNPTTPSYRGMNLDALAERGVTAIAHFGRWLEGGEVDAKVRAFCLAIGEERKKQGFALHEVLSSVTLLRKHLWTFTRSRGVWEKPIDVYRVLELNRRIAVFFDKVLYYTARAFEGDAKR